MFYYASTILLGLHMQIMFQSKIKQRPIREHFLLSARQDTNTQHAQCRAKSQQKAHYFARFVLCPSTRSAILKDGSHVEGLTSLSLYSVS